jgi:ribonuclease P protein component
VKKRERLRSPREFQRVLATRRAFSGVALVAFVSATEQPGGGVRLGVTTSRRLRGAVLRNRARRRLREIARTTLLADDSPLRRPGIRFDVVLIARPAAAEVDFRALRAEAAQVLDAARTL